MIGRKIETQKIERLQNSERSEFLAVTGRRRVGKTYLVDTLLKNDYCFSITGIQNGTMATQLVNFTVKLSEYDGTYAPKAVDNWLMAFLSSKSTAFIFGLLKTSV